MKSAFPVQLYDKIQFQSVQQTESASCFSLSVHSHLVYGFCDI